MKNFGETLKKIRKQKDMTQEQLAEYLNISPQSVSKWETNLTLPDITLIPMLANIFDVSTDMLLGVDIMAKEKRVQEILDNANEYSSNAYFNKAAEVLREGLKEYPNSYKIMDALMGCVWRERSDTGKNETIALGEKILAECTDDDIRHSAIQILCYTYPTVGKPEKAEELAQKIPTSSLSRESLTRNIYPGTKRFKAYQNSIHSDFIMALWLTQCINSPLDDGSSPYTTEELIIIHKKLIAIIEILLEDKNYGFFFLQKLSWIYIEIAKFYAQLKDYNNAVESLKFASEYSIKNDTVDSSDDEYTCLLFRGKNIGGVGHNITENESLHQLNEMKNPAFDLIREREDFAAIAAELKKYAKNR